MHPEPHPPFGSGDLAEYLSASVRRFPERVAVVDPSGFALTYAQLGDLAARMSGLLAARGVEAGDRVAVLLPKSAAAVIALFGALGARAVAVPIDVSAPAGRVRTILQDAEARAVVVDPRFAASAAGAEALAGQQLLELDPFSAWSGSSAPVWDVLAAQSPLASPRRPTADDVAYILYTSGSTGVPKGVVISHGNASSFVDWCSDVFSPTEADRFSSHAPFHFDLSVLDIYLCIKHGGTLFLIEEGLGREPRELARFIADNRLTVWYSTPSILSLLCEYGDLARQDLSALRLVLFAGEVFPVKALRRLTEIAPGPAYYNLYGPTETNVCTYAKVPELPPERTAPCAIGWPCSHCAALVLDESGQPVPDGEEGLLYIAGAPVFQGYRGRPAETARAFLERDGRRWYNTGDVVRLDPVEGYVYVGRRDRMVKRRGFRIELGEIENALHRHPALREAAAIAATGETATTISAFVVPRAERPSIVDLKSFCAAQLPAYMSPDSFHFLEALPRTSTDKVDYQALRGAAGAPAAAAPVAAAPTSPTAHV